MLLALLSLICNSENNSISSDSSTNISSITAESCATPDYSRRIDETASEWCARLPDNAPPSVRWAVQEIEKAELEGKLLRYELKSFMVLSRSE